MLLQFRLKIAQAMLRVPLAKRLRWELIPRVLVPLRASGTFSALSSTVESTNGSGVASFTSMTYTGSIGTVYLCATDTTDGYS